MEEAFRERAGMELSSCQSPADLVREGERLGLQMPHAPSWEEAFHVIFLSLVEPELPRDRPLVLMDYPLQIPTTAKRKTGTPYAERWELYIQGVEIANCYSEETDPQRMEAFLHAEDQRKKTARVTHPVDTGFGEIFRSGFPACAGAALGADRLEMVLTSGTSLEGVILFPLSDILGHTQSGKARGNT